MKKSFITSHLTADTQFNLTPMIDVVFLLMIFFMMICQFIVQENYRLVIPDDCTTAVVPDRLDRNAITVSVFPNPALQRRIPSLDSTTRQDHKAVLYAVRAYQYDPHSPVYREDPQQLLADMSTRIANESKRKADPLVHLRADKDLSYGDVQKALQVLAMAGISKVQLAAFRSEQDQ